MKQKLPYLILMFAAGIILFFALGSIIKSVKVIKHGVYTESSVTHASIPSKGGFSNVTVSFNLPDGREVSATASTRQWLHSGNKVKIYYDPSFPEKIDFGDTISYNMRGVVLGGLLFILGLFLFLRFYLKEKANKKLIKSGRRIAADFVSVERNEKYRMGDKNPWRIKCKWTDSYSNKEYFFLSKDYTIDPAPFLAGRSRIDVYLDPANPAKYYMDLAFMPKGNNTIG